MLLILTIIFLKRLFESGNGHMEVDFEPFVFYTLGEWFHQFFDSFFGLVAIRVLKEEFDFVTSFWVGRLVRPKTVLNIFSKSDMVADGLCMCLLR